MREIVWTKHAEYKMREYRLSESRIRRIIKTPARIEEGIAENTIALMQPNGRGKGEHEIWVMVSDADDKRKVVSAWRYPGRTKEGEALPKAILDEFNKITL
ncbi:MAG: hypothetical protein COT88_00530 [Candidatus Colwellbacteria bacterium CG10_big_fil_rev_8_21_14_0_10_41_28]|uniref:DUF4258 domain-containing protein n=1 Tax=Candidatus Colwellbacteria bacterium CG10_big_fil_rev_8_21_14_0_10_41_28 TaxID=1974539 RepID=A0A2H0VHR3_9BACT|nr:MAG: hypothetical protein COT88_00530 [Candidatus Colwellbacteria bacterium CG10_big_fil_rev_8_21_14_0_10_41_28]